MIPLRIEPRYLEAWAISGIIHGVLALLLFLVVPAFDRPEEAPPPLSIRLAFESPPNPTAAEATPRARQEDQTPITTRPTTEERPSPRAPDRVPASGQPPPMSPSREEVPAPVVTQRPDQETPSTPTAPVVPTTPVTEARPPRPRFDLSGLDEGGEGGDAGETLTQKTELPGMEGSLEVEGGFTALRANPPRPLLREVQNAFGLVEIAFTVQGGLLRVEAIRFLDGSVTQIGAAEQERLRAELRHWLRAWTLLGAREGARGRITVRLVPAGGSP